MYPFRIKVACRIKIECCVPVPVGHKNIILGASLSLGSQPSHLSQDLSAYCPILKSQFLFRRKVPKFNDNF